MTTFDSPEAMLRSAAIVVGTGGKELLWSDPHTFDDGTTNWSVDVSTRYAPFPGDYEAATDEEIEAWYETAPLIYDPMILSLTVHRKHPNGRTMYAKMGYSRRVLSESVVDLMPIIVKDIEMMFTRCAATEPT